MERVSILYIQSACYEIIQYFAGVLFLLIFVAEVMLCHVSLPCVSFMCHLHVSSSCVIFLCHLHVSLSFVIFMYHLPVSLSCVTVMCHLPVSLSCVIGWWRLAIFVLWNGLIGVPFINYCYSTVDKTMDKQFYAGSSFSLLYFQNTYLFHSNFFGNLQTS